MVSFLSRSTDPLSDNSVLLLGLEKNFCCSPMPFWAEDWVVVVVVVVGIGGELYWALFLPEHASLHSALLGALSAMWDTM